MNLAYHFVRGTGGNMKLRDGRRAVVGEWLEHEGPAVLCKSGLHASWRAIDALRHLEWEGGSACLVEVDNIISEENDKFVCTRRRIVFAVPCDELLRIFARQCALSVLHLWQGEVPAVVREYIETGNKYLQRVAWSAANAAARGAASCEAAWAAAWAAANAASYASAWAAANAASRDAAWVAARYVKISDLNFTLESLIIGAAIQGGFDPSVLS